MRVSGVVLALSLAALPGLAAAATLERGPYVHGTTAGAATVVWRTAEDSTGTVRFGTAPGVLDGVVNGDVIARQHEARLEGLAPSTRYYYEVRAGGELLAGGPDFYFDTAPPVGGRAKIRAWVVGDSGTGDAIQAGVRDAMLDHVGAYRPQIFLHVGDMAYLSGTDQEFTDHFFAPYAGILRSATIWPAIGNHEGMSASSATQTGPYYDAYVLPKAGEAGGLASGTEAYYAFDHGNIHFVVLDSYGTPRAPDGAMLTWLAADLAATDQEWIIAFWHHPPYSKGSHDSDLEVAHVEMREYALPILEAGGVDLVLGGHSHIYERSYLVDGGYETPTTDQAIVDDRDGRPAGDGPYVKPAGGGAHEGALYVVAGHGGATLGGTGGHPLMFFSELVHGSCVLDVHENRLTLINVRDDGEVTDHVALMKGEGIEVFTPNGGELLAGGAKTTIRWATVGAIPAVAIDFSLDDGAIWTPIVASTPNMGDFVWKMPNVTTDRALVRVRDAADPGRGDESNAGFSLVAGAEAEVVPFGAIWRYNDVGLALSLAWRSLDFDDASWPVGLAQLGYGDGDEATVLADVDPNRPTAYFRRTFELDAEVVAAELQVLFDDGVAVWINDNLVASANVDGLAYADWATAPSLDNEIRAFDVPLEPYPFVDGTNVVAVMVKQVDGGSSDLSFDLSLRVTKSPFPESTGDASDGGDGGSATGGGGDGGGGCLCAAPPDGERGGGLVVLIAGLGAAATRRRGLQRGLRPG